MFSSTGMSLTLHYCGDSIASVGFSEEVSCCCDEDMSQPQDDDCCKNEIKPIKITIDQIKANYNEEKFVHFDYISTPNFFLFNKKQNYNYKYVVQPTPLPRPPDKTLILPPYKMNHSYLFYS